MEGISCFAACEYIVGGKETEEYGTRMGGWWWLPAYRVQALFSPSIAFYVVYDSVRVSIPNNQKPMI